MSELLKTAVNAARISALKNRKSLQKGAMEETVYTMVQGRFGRRIEKSYIHVY